MSLANCFSMLNKGKPVFSPEEIKEIRALAFKSVKGIGADAAEKHAVQTLLNEAHAERHGVLELIHEAMGLPAPKVEEKPARTDKIGSNAEQPILEKYLAESPEDRSKLSVVVTFKNADGKEIRGSLASQIEARFADGYRVALTKSGPAFVNDKMQGHNERDISPAGMRYANWLSSNEKVPANETDFVSKPAQEAKSKNAELSSALAKYEDTGELSTVNDLANEVESLIDDGKAPGSLQSAIDDYRQELADDHEMAGRGDMEAADENFVAAVKSAIAAGEAKAEKPANLDIQQEQAPIEDFGQKIEGARKDLAAAMKKEYSDDDIARLPLSKIWPADLSDKIEDPYIAAIAFAARQEIPSKPHVSYKVARWVEKVKTLRLLASIMMSSDTMRATAEARLNENKALEGFKAKVTLLESLDRSQWKRIGSVGEHPNAYRYEPDGEGKSKQVSSPSVHVQIDGRTEYYPGAKSVADVIEKVNEKLGIAPKEAKMKFEVRGRGDSYFINKAGDSEYRHLKEFTSSKEALDYRNSNHDDLVKAWEAVKERDNVKETDVRGEENRPRTAQDWRKGKDITTEQFSEEFGFRGGQFGNWVNQGKNIKERQGMLNGAYDALMDLSDIIGVPPKALSLNGDLGMSFGARGSGSASAHYESDNLVINLTKTRGAGTLAHEWFHALDNYFQRSRNAPMDSTRETRYITYKPEPLYVYRNGTNRMTKAQLEQSRKDHPSNEYYAADRWKIDPSHPEGVRPEVEAKFAELVQALNDSPMTKRASLIDKGKSDGYWSRIIERAARSFENYVIAKMAEKGYNNDYLANVKDISEFKRDAGRYPYLKAEELAPVVEAFDNLFGEMKTKETDKGTALYQSSVEYNTGDQIRRLEDFHNTSRADAEVMYQDGYRIDPDTNAFFKLARADQVVFHQNKDAYNEASQATQDLYAGREQRPDTTDEQRRIGRDAYREILSPYARRAGASVLGSRIAKDFEAQGGASLVGQVANTHEDLAVLAQVVRDPRFETFRIFFTKGGSSQKAFTDYQRILRSWYGNDEAVMEKATPEELKKLETLGAAVMAGDRKIVGQTGITSRMPGQVNVVTGDKTLSDLTDSLTKQKDALDADGYWLLHNHPSGRATPSTADKSLTSAIAERMKGFLGHVVIDHDEYSNIKADGNYTLHDKVMPHYFNKDVVEVPHDALSRSISGASEVANVGKMIERKEGFFTLIGRTARAEVSAIAQVPLSLLDKGGMQNMRLIATLRRFAVQTGSPDIVAVSDEAGMKQLLPLVKKGLLLDVVDVNSGNGRGTTSFTSAREVTQPEYDAQGLFGNAKSIRVEQGSGNMYSPERDKATDTHPGAGMIDSLKSTVSRLLTESGLDKAVHDVQLAATPMSTGSDIARKIAKDYANTERLATYEWHRIDKEIQDKFTEAQQVKMWDAADAENDLRREGKTSDTQGLNSLNTDERAMVEKLHDYGEQLMTRARSTGMFAGEGVPYWTPRMAVMVGEDGEYARPAGGKGGGKEGGNVSTYASSLQQRKYLTSAETEAAMKARLDAGDKSAELVKNIRTMPMAMARIEKAIAARELINQVKAIGKLAGKETVSGEAKPQFFTLDHPAFKTFRPKFIEQDGKLVAALDQNGNTVFEKTPLYISKEFEGPLKAIMSSKSSTPYNWAMQLKAKSMALIMYSPMIHNAVEWGRAYPAMDWKGKLSLGAYTYLTGNKAKNDPVMMREAITNGMVPIGGRGNLQDITGIAAGPSLQVGKSWTAKVLAAPVALISEKGAFNVKKAVDTAGKFWHETLLWDRVGDLQMGLYTTMKSSLVNKGFSEFDAGHIAAHESNRFAGAMSNESMSANARKFLNLTLFSRTFTLGNLGVMKDMITGLPKDVQAQIKMNSGAIAAQAAKSQGRKIAIATVVTDIGLMYLVNGMLQSYLNPDDKSTIDDRLAALGKKFNIDPMSVLTRPLNSLESLTPGSMNEPGKEERIKWGRDSTGTEIYARQPAGKIGEEFGHYLDFPSGTLKQLHSKMSTMLKPLVDTALNDTGVGQKVYDSSKDASLAKNIGKVVWHFMQAQVPTDQILSAYDTATGHADDMDMRKLVGPLAGVTFSKGAAGGPEVGMMYAASRDYQDKVASIMPEVKRALKLGDKEEAIKLMREINMPPQEMWKHLRTIESPQTRLNPVALRKFNQHATGEDKDRMSNLNR